MRAGQPPKGGFGPRRAPKLACTHAGQSRHFDGINGPKRARYSGPRTPDSGPLQNTKHGISARFGPQTPENMLDPFSPVRVELSVCTRQIFTLAGYLRALVCIVVRSAANHHPQGYNLGPDPARARSPKHATRPSALCGARVSLLHSTKHLCYIDAVRHALQRHNRKPTQPMPKIVLTSQERRALSARAGCDLRTVAACYDGKPMLFATYRAIAEASAELNLTPPPVHKAQQRGAA